MMFLKKNWFVLLLLILVLVLFFSYVLLNKEIFYRLRVIPKSNRLGYKIVVGNLTLLEKIESQYGRRVYYRVTLENELMDNETVLISEENKSILSSHSFSESWNGLNINIYIDDLSLKELKASSEILSYRFLLAVKQYLKKDTNLYFLDTGLLSDIAEASANETLPLHIMND